MAQGFSASIFAYSVFLFATVSAERPSYFITAPNVFHVGVGETVSVSVYNVSQRVKIKLYLQDYPNKQKILSAVESSFENDKPKIVHLKVNAEDLPATEPGDKQHVYLVAQSLSPHLPFIRYTKILVSPRNAVVFIQTDKPIYTPFQSVKIRVIPLGFDLRSSRTKINLIIKNPQQVKVQQWKDLNTDTGFISKNLHLQGSAMIGNWTVSAFYGHQLYQNTTVKFEVREYVLPTYWVKISGPDYILPRVKTVNINIGSSYTYGKPVEGEVHLKLSVVGRGKEPVLVFSQYGPLKSGKKTFKFLNDLVKKHRLIQKFPTGRRLQIEADVIEKATGRKESAIDNSIYFVESPFTVNCDKTPKYFKPGLPFEIKVQVLYPNRNPASGINIHLMASGSNSKGVKVALLGRVNGRPLLRLNDRTDGKGVCYFVIDIPRNTKSVKIKLETKEPSLPNTKKELVVKPYQSPSGSYILIRENREREKVGHYEVLSNKNISRLTYMVVARGKIVTQSSMRRAFGVITTIKIPITPELSPSARIIVHCTVNGNEVVADSLLIYPEDKLSNEIQLLPDTRFPSNPGDNDQNVPPPGSDYQIRIKGQPNTRVALLGLDQSVYLLRNKYKLTTKKVFKTLGSLDLGCGVGPEETNKEVFEKAGLAVISNRNLVTDPREEFGCKESSSKRRKRSLVSTPEVCCGYGKFPLGRITCARKLKFMLMSNSYTDACLRMFYNCCTVEWGETDAPPFDKIVVVRGRNREKGFEEFGAAMLSEEELLENSQVRTDFPETWIYEEDVIGTSGEMLFDVTLPHTITSWSIQAMAMSNTSGFGMAAPLSVRTYQPFFVSVSLPYSVQRGEQFAVVATVFNYIPSVVDGGEVNIYIEGSDDFCSSVRADQRSKAVTLTLKAHDSQSATFPIVPIRLGNIPIKVIAVSKTLHAADKVEKMLLVVPEGVERTITHSLAIDPQGVLRDEDKPNKTAPTKPFTSGRVISDGKQMDNVFLTIPKRTIPGSMSATLSLTGNLIGPVVTNLITGGFDELLRMPTGCGEQTMIYMAPNVYVLQYLTNTKQVTAAVETRSYRYIQSGYQNELNYRRADKSFSAFGESRPGSTWLTAFVMRVFCAAQKFSGIAIDENLICESVTWLSRNQRADGAFPERHDVVHKSMTGGIHGDVAMTSFVLMSLLECRCKGKKNTVAVSRAVSYLEMELRNVYRPHAVAMTTYALVLAKSPQRFMANQKLIQMAVYDSDKATRHWNAGGIALSIETSAYALLTQIIMGRVKYAGPIVSWLTAQRNAQGGFSSTQDTCVALEALAKYSERTAGANLDLRVSFTAEQDPNWRRTFHITNQNALVMSQEDISRVMGGDIFIDSTGTGVGQLQIEVRHNVPSSRNESCLFDVTTVVKERIKNKGGSVLGRAGSDDDDDESRGRAGGRRKRRCRRKNRRNKKKCKRRKKQKTQPKTPDSLTLKICTRYRKPGKSGMTIMDIGIFTGFEADSDSLEQLKENVRPTVDRFEISDRHVVLYISEVYSHKEFCAMFKVNRVHKVGTIQPVPVKVYDYYEPDEACTTFYGPDKYSALVLGICEEEQCSCTQDSCSACDPVVKKTTDLLTKACTEYDYAFRGRVGLVDEFNKRKESWLVYTLTIKEVIKPGDYNFVVGEIVEFMKRAGCRCPEMKMKKDYLIMGKNKRQQFLLDDKTFVKRWPRKGIEKNLFIDFRARMSSRNRCG